MTMVGGVGQRGSSSPMNPHCVSVVVVVCSELESKTGTRRGLFGRRSCFSAFFGTSLSSDCRSGTMKHSHIDDGQWECNLRLLITLLIVQSIIRIYLRPISEACDLQLLRHFTPDDATRL